MTAPIRSMPELLMVAENNQVVAVVRRHADLIDVFRLMKERLQLTNEFCDDVGGLTKGHTDKILGPTEAKNIGPVTFDLFCEMFAIEFRVHIDLSAVKRMEAVWEGRERPLYPNARVKRISKKLVERAKPLVFKDSGRIGGIVRSHLLTPKQRSEIASKAAKARHRKRRRDARAKAALAAPCSKHA
jgi:hypothetical protein